MLFIIIIIIIIIYKVDAENLIWSRVQALLVRSTPNFHHLCEWCGAIWIRTLKGQGLEKGHQSPESCFQLCSQTGADHKYQTGSEGRNLGPNKGHEGGPGWDHSREIAAQGAGIAYILRDSHQFSYTCK